MGTPKKYIPSRINDVETARIAIEELANRYNQLLDAVNAIPTSPTLPTNLVYKDVGGHVAAADLGTGSGGAAKFLREDQTWQAVAVGASARRYYLVMVEKTQNPAAFIRIGEIKLHSAIGGANIAVGGTVLFTEQFSTSGDNSAAAGFDNDATTAWCNLGSNRPAGLGYLLPAAAVIPEFTITCRGDGFGPDCAPVAGSLISSPDGVNWSQEWSFMTPATWVAGEARIFTRPS